MSDLFKILLENMLSPIVLFFFLGVISSLLKSDLSIPEAIGKGISIYLLFAIGFKGGVSVSSHGVDAKLALSMLLATILSFSLPYVAYLILTKLVKLDRLNAAAVAGHYGSISIVTFVAATTVLSDSKIFYEGYMIAVAAIMEAPAILSALWLAGRGSSNKRTSVREIAFNGSVLLLIGSFIIGAITGDEALNVVSGFVKTPFKGVLCLFLLDMGIIAGSGLVDARKYLKPSLIAFGLAMPLIGSIAGIILGYAVGLSSGGAIIFGVLGASASYIAVPAAMRSSLPDANPSIYLTLSLGITFPFNLVVGIPLYIFMTNVLYGI